MQITRNFSQILFTRCAPNRILDHLLLLFDSGLVVCMRRMHIYIQTKNKINSQCEWGASARDEKENVNVTDECTSYTKYRNTWLENVKRHVWSFGNSNSSNNSTNSGNSSNSSSTSALRARSHFSRSRHLSLCRVSLPIALFVTKNVCSSSARQRRRYYTTDRTHTDFGFGAVRGNDCARVCVCASFFRVFVYFIFINYSHFGDDTHMFSQPLATRLCLCVPIELCVAFVSLLLFWARVSQYTFAEAHTNGHT